MASLWALCATIPWWVWSLVSNVAVAIVEYQNRTGGFANPVQAFTRTGPALLLMQIALFYNWRDAPKFMLAWAAFFFGNCIVRVISAHFFVGEPISFNTAIGILLVGIGFHVIRSG